MTTGYAFQKFDQAFACYVGTTDIDGEVSAVVDPLSRQERLARASTYLMCLKEQDLREDMQSEFCALMLLAERALSLSNDETSEAVDRLYTLKAKIDFEFETDFELTPSEIVK